MQGAAQVPLGSQSLHLGTVALRALQGHEPEAVGHIEASQAPRDPGADAAPRIVEDRELAVPHEARRRVGCTWMRTG